MGLNVKASIGCSGQSKSGVAWTGPLVRVAGEHRSVLIGARDCRVDRENVGGDKHHGDKTEWLHGATAPPPPTPSPALPTLGGGPDVPHPTKQRISRVLTNDMNSQPKRENIR